MLLYILFFSSLGCISGTLSDDETIVQDWLTLNSTLQIVRIPSSGYVSPNGQVQLISTGQGISPEYYDCPDVQRELQILKFNGDLMQFRFVQVEGHLGFIEHHCGNVVVQPLNGSPDPSDKTHLIVHPDRVPAALFYFDEESMRVVHRGGKFFYPDLGDVTPIDGAYMEVQSNGDDASRFRFVPIDSPEASVYPPPVLSGHWEMIFPVIDPLVERTLTIAYKVGKSMVKQASEIQSWKVSASSAYSWFSASAEFSYFSCISETLTWSAQIDRIYTIKVSPGRSSITWQWVFEAERFGEIYRFRSNLLGDTDDVTQPPQINPSMYNTVC